MNGVSSMVHLFSLLIFFVLIFVGIVLKKRANLLKNMMLSGTNHAKTKVLVDWPTRFLREVCLSLGIDFESSVSYKRLAPAKIQLDVLSKFIREYSISKVICGLSEESNRMCVIFISNTEPKVEVEHAVRSALGGQVDVSIERG